MRDYRRSDGILHPKKPKNTWTAKKNDKGEPPIDETVVESATAKQTQLIFKDDDVAFIRIIISFMNNIFQELCSQSFFFFN